MYADLNVPWPKTQPEQRISEIIKYLSILGYDIVALNVIASSPKEAKQVLATSLTDTALHKLQVQYPKMKFLRRITLVLENSTSNPNLGLLTEPGLCDLIAVIPKTEKQLQSCATSLDIDLICVETGGRLSFPLRHKLCGAAVARGINFELCYTTEKPLRHLISNASALFRATRNRGIVTSSGAISASQLRAPLDVANMIGLWGLNSNAARESMSRLAVEAATQGVLRSRSAKQAIIPEDLAEKPPSKKQKVDDHL